MGSTKKSSICVPMRFALMVDLTDYVLFFNKFILTCRERGVWIRAFCRVVVKGLLTNCFTPSDGESEASTVILDISSLYCEDPNEVFVFGRILQRKAEEWLTDDINLRDFVRNLGTEIEDLVCKVCDGAGKIGGVRKKITCPQCGGRKWAEKPQ